MLIGYDSLILIMVISLLVQVIALIIQSFLINSKTSLIWWILSGFMGVSGYIVLSMAQLGVTNDLFLLGGISVMSLSNIIRTYGVEKEFSIPHKGFTYQSDRSYSSVFFVLSVINIALTHFTIYYFRDYQAAIALLFVFKALTDFFGLWILRTYRNKALTMTKALLTIVYVVSIGMELLIAWRLYNSYSTLNVFGHQQVLVYSFEFIITIIWTLTILTLNINQVEIIRHENELKYETLFNINPEMQVIIRENNLEIVSVNDSFSEVTGYNKEEVIGQRIDSLPVFNLFVKKYQGFKELMEAALNNSIEVHIDSPRLQMIGLLSINRFRLGEENLLISGIKNVTDLNQFQRENQILSEVVMQSPVAVVLTDLDGTITFVNDRFTTLTGYSRDEAVGQKSSILKSGQYDDKYYADLWATISAGKEWRAEMINKRKDNTFYWEQNLIVPIKDEQNVLLAYLAMKDDITENKRAEASLTQKAHLDGLTNIYNYGYFMEMVEQAMKAEWSENQQNAYIMFDVDDFKQVNDQHGHLFADRVLREMAASFGDLLRKGDIYGRIGGEEFACLIIDTNVEVASRIAERIRQRIASTKFINDKNEIVNITVSIGVHLFDQNAKIDDIMKMADDALYESKKNGKDQFTIF